MPDRSAQTRPLRALTALLLASLALGASAGDDVEPDVVRLSEPVSVANGFETFGAPLDRDMPVVTLSYLVGNADALLGRPVQVATRVGKVCQKKGCFFVAHDGAISVRVSFRDYGFFVPTDAGGKYVTLAGELVRRERSAGEAKHLAEDLGGSAEATAAGDVLEIVATSVRIPRG